MLKEQTTISFFCLLTLQMFIYKENLYRLKMQNCKNILFKLLIIFSSCPTQQFIFLWHVNQPMAQLSQ